ncbi:MAG: RNA-guided pseudouridylation complex pseudouridine synthase subunit Cbf5 [Methanobacteriaceae archaeon]|jgi:H/ACA ribonucleoprotein complex subunit 4|nr:RNA-guided pseudouridylation complex pseudouridine synthase subunit Cbf5 [Candidatus Methanorudis spinitermitis]
MEKLLIIAESTTDSSFGLKPQERPIEEHIDKGIINLDKPSGPTSHEIDSWVRRILKSEKTGHGGTLDPKVTGVLPIGINNATRVIQLLLPAPKEYVCLMRLHKDLNEDRINEIFNEFQGKIFQTPPLKSAVKRELRVRNVYNSNILEISERDVLFKIACEAGTYIRTYCHDIGEALGTGAHMAELRRTQVGPLNENKDLITLQDLTDAFYYWNVEGDESYIRKCILPMEKATDFLPKVLIRDSAVDAICHGANLASGGIVGLSENIKKGKNVAILTLKGELVASAETLYNLEDIIDSSSKIVFDTKKVFMKPGIYPMMWK